MFGVSVNLDFSWVIIAVLVTWSLAKGFFPANYRNLSPGTYWAMGVLGTLGLFASIILHEFSHSLVAKKNGLPMKGITLFIFGGVAEMSDEPPSPKTEFLMAIAGPAISILVAIVFGILAYLSKQLRLALPVIGVVSYLSFINGLLAAFNLIPGFPLDGGRILRSALWYWKNNLRWATRIASQVGSLFGMILIMLGIISLVTGNFIGGFWWFLIGMFLRNAASSSYQQVLIRHALEGETVRDFMNSSPISVPTELTLDEFIENYIYRHHFKMFPVQENGTLLGCVTVQQIKQIPKDRRHLHTVGELAQACSEDNTVNPDADAMKVLSKMSQKGVSRLMVVENHQLVGIITLKDMLSFFSLKMELGDNA